MSKEVTVEELSWNNVNFTLPPEGKKVDTKIDDGKGLRNETVLVRKGNLWFFEDMSMYVYYTPTHWRYNQQKLK